MNKLNVNWSCRINDTSYGLVGFNLLKGLVQLGHDVVYWPIEDEDRIRVQEENYGTLLNCLYKRGKYDRNAPSIRHSYPNDLAQHVGKGLHIGSTVFELNTLKPDQHHHMNSLDGIITASQWGAQVLRQNNITKPIGVVPHGVDRTIFNENVVPSLAFKDNPTVFLNVSKKEVRKGHIELIEAFNQAFKPNDNVMLVMAWYNRFYSKEENDRWDSLYKDTPMGNRVQLLPTFLETQNEIAKLYSSADCGVFPSKAEGFGLGPLEMMACGKQVILTNYSGHTEFSTPENSMQIEIDDLENAHDGFWFKGEGQWASLENDQINQMIVHMRKTHGDKQDGRNLINTHGLQTAKQFSWSNAADKLVNFVGGFN